MKTFIDLLLFLGLVGGLVSCQEEFHTTIGHTLEGQFIEAEIDGVPHYLATTNGCSSANKYYYQDAPELEFPLDQLNVMRQSQQGDRAIYFYVLQGRLLQDEFPIFYEAEELTAYCRHVELQYYEEKGSKRERVYKGLVNMILQDWDEEGFLTGSFDGVLRSEGGDLKKIDDGAFRIRVFKESL